MKKLLVVLLASIMLLASAAPTFAAANNGNGNGNNGNNGNGNGNNKVENTYVEGAGIKQDFNNAQFHCNAINGNGRVWPEIPADMKKFDGSLEFTKAEGTRWNLTKVFDKKGVQLSMVVCPHCGSTEWITFSNNSGVPDGKNVQMQHPGAEFTIVKGWIKNNAPYEIGVKFFSNFKVTLSSGKTFMLGPGKYFLPSDLEAAVVETSCTNGFDLVKVLLNGEEVGIGMVEGIVGGDVVTFINEDDPPGDFFSGTISVEKWVGGQNIVDWFIATYGEDALTDMIDFFDGMRFQLYAVAGDGAEITGSPIVFGTAPSTFDFVTIDLSGLVIFPDVAPGWYAIVENFVDGSLAKDIFKGIAPLYVYVGQSLADSMIGSGGEGNYTVIVTDFHYDAFYTIVNGFGGGYVLGYPGLNRTGDIFYIGVTNADTGKVYDSFCANAGSRAFAGQSGMGCEGYLVAQSFRDNATFADFVSAYNYIADNIGDLNEYRAVTQIVTWYLLGAIEDLGLINWGVVEAGTDAIKGIADARSIVEDVIANYAGYEGAGTIVDVVYMVCEDGHPYEDCQPQLVPVYGETIIFENQLA